MSASWVRRTLLFPLRTQFMFLLHFTELIVSGEDEDAMDPKTALTILRRIYTEQAGIDASEVKVANELLANLQDGDDIHDAMKEWFHPDICLTYRASMESGSGVAGVNKIIGVMREQNQLKRSFFVTMFVPTMLMLVGLIMFAIVSIHVIPTFFDGVNDINKASLLVRAVVAGGQILSHVWLPALLFISIMAGTAFYFMPRKGLSAVYRNFSAGRFFALFALLISSEMSIREALQILLPHVAPYLQDHLEEMLDKTQFGVTEFRQLDTGLLPLELRVRLQVSGEKGSGSSTEIFNIISQNAAKDFRSAILRACSTAKWAMIGCGLSMLFLAFGSIFAMASDAIAAA